MSLSEFDSFERFLIILLQKHTVSIHDSGIVNLQRIFTLPNIINLVSPAPATTQSVQTPVDTKAESNGNTLSIANL